MSKEDKRSAGSSIEVTANSAVIYTAYLAGGLFTQHELTTNVLIKEAVCRLSNGRFELVLPQSKELRDLDRPDLAAYLRNVDLLQAVKADVLIARFDGPELDTGTVVEFMIARILGKPSVILRSDARHLAGKGLDEPYNLMVKSWPRTVEVHIDSLMNYAGLIAEKRGVLDDPDSFGTMMDAELGAIRSGVDNVATKLVSGLKAAIEMSSPYPPEYQENVYRAFRFSPGCGFDGLLPEDELEAIIQKLRNNATL